ncbi:MAG: glycerophosphodiester phosphodiesterase family protein [Ignavibacteria bacterium]|jgi:glycerophosphoryl diester phosphodiesterase
MIKLKFILFCLIFAVQACNADEPDKQASKFNYEVSQMEKENIDDIKSLLEDSNSDKVMTILHRGDWRNAPENSLQAIQNAIDMGIDIVEIDIRKTKDGEFILMHDNTLNRTTTGKGLVSDYTLAEIKQLNLKNGLGSTRVKHKVPSLREALLLAKGKIMFNADKAYDYIREIHEHAKQTGTADHIIYKGWVDFDKFIQDYGDLKDSIYFMPIADLRKKEGNKDFVIKVENENGESMVEEFVTKLQPVAIEFVFADTLSSVLNKLYEYRKQGTRTWVNSLWPSICAGYDDDAALSNPDSVYGWLISKGFNMIQTDRPKFLLDYLKNRNSAGSLAH